MSGFDNNNFHELIREVAEENGIEEAKVIFKDDNGSINGLLGIIRKFKIEGIKDNELVSLPMVGKVITDHQSTRESLPLDVFAKNEYHMYSAVFPEFDKLLQEIGSNININRPKCYKASAIEFKEVIIMEDLAVKGFEQSKIGISLDFEHSVLVLEQMAAFHAVSFVYKDKYPKKLEQLCGEQTDMLFTHLPHLSDTLEKAVDYAEVHARCDESEEVMKAFHKCDIIKKNRFLLDGKNNEYSVLCHGDFWANNVLFRYKNKTPTSVMVLDWQCIRYSSPVTDLLFFMFIAVNDELRADRFQDLIDIYYNALKANVTTLGCNPDVLYPENVFREHLKTFSYAGFTSALIMLPIFTGATAILSGDEDFMEAFKNKQEAMSNAKPKEIYIKQMMRTIKDVKQHNLHCFW